MISLEYLISCNEAEWLDFKREFHTDNASLLHDVLCLANAYADGDRYLVFGVKNDRTIFGVEEDPHRKTNADIQSFLRTVNLNRIPTANLRFYEEFSGHTVAILTIKNRPDKPFYVVKDFVVNIPHAGKGFEKKVVRNGVIYTRIGDTNVPMNECAPEDHVELMWRERFGLGLDPLGRLARLLNESDNWQTIPGMQSLFYHKLFPEFTIVEGEDVTKDFEEPWTLKFPDTHARSYYVECRYHTTVLRKCMFVSCDGGRYHVPIPRRTGDDTFALDTSSLEYKIACLYHQYMPLETVLPRCGVTLY